MRERRWWFLEFLIVAHALSSLQSALSPRHFPQLEREGGKTGETQNFLPRGSKLCQNDHGLLFLSHDTYDCFVFLPGMEQQGRGTVFFFDE